MQSLGQILKKQMPQKPIAKQVAATIVVEKANEVLKEIFGAESSRFSQAVFFKDKSIAITCLSSVMAQEIRLNEKQIIAGLNNKLGGVMVERVRYLA